MLPVRARKAAVPVVHASLGVLVRRGRVYVQQRPARGLLGGMWEFPGGKAVAGEAAAETLRRELKEELGIRVRAAEPVAEVAHAYSHFRVVLRVFVCRVWEGRIRCTPPHRWVTWDELDGLPLPAANRRFLAAVRPDRLRAVVST